MNYSSKPLRQTDDKTVFDNKVESNMGLVYSVAKMFLGRNCDFEDLVQIGAIGLIKAVKRFDESFGVCFSTYAVPMITGEIRRFLRDDGIIKISRTVKENAAKGKRVAEQLRQTGAKEPTLAEIAKASGICKEDLVYAFEACSDCVSMDAQNEDGIKKEYGVCEEEDTVDRILLSEAIRSLPVRERQVIIMRYMNDCTQSVVAQALGVSQVQVSRIEKKAISIMKNMLI